VIGREEIGREGRCGREKRGGGGTDRQTRRKEAGVRDERQTPSVRPSLSWLEK
jgi:hypothetical protein